MTEMHAASPGEVQVFYTYCHLVHAGNVDHELGWVAEELARHGARLSYFLSVPETRLLPPLHARPREPVPLRRLHPGDPCEGGPRRHRAPGSPVVLGGRRDARARGRRHREHGGPRRQAGRPLQESQRRQGRLPPGHGGARHSSSCSACTTCAATTFRSSTARSPTTGTRGTAMAEPLPDLLDFWRAYGVQADLLQRPLQPDLEAGVIDACFVTDPFGLEYADSESVRLVGSLARQPRPHPAGGRSPVRPHLHAAFRRRAPGAGDGLPAGPGPGGTLGERRPAGLRRPARGDRVLPAGRDAAPCGRASRPRPEPLRRRTERDRRREGVDARSAATSVGTSTSTTGRRPSSSAAALRGAGRGRLTRRPRRSCRRPTPDAKGAAHAAPFASQHSRTGVFSRVRQRGVTR